MRRIQGIAIPTNNIEDSFCEGLASSRDFTTNSATWLAHSSSPLISHDWNHKWK